MSGARKAEDRAVKVAIVTGGSSGIGLAACRLLAAEGYAVYDFSRHQAEDSPARHIYADVTDEPSLAAGLEQVLAEQGCLDLLVNNAGCGVSGAAEFTPLAIAQQQLAVNFFGQVSMNRLAIPALRESCGMIINLSSVAGELAIPFQSFYSASKAAVNAYTLALANELRPFGVRVAALLPGDVKTGFTAARHKCREELPLYGETIRKAVAAMEKDEQNGMPPQQVARAIVKLARQKHPRPLTTVGGKYQLFMILGKFLPARLSNWIVGKMYG